MSAKADPPICSYCGESLDLGRELVYQIDVQDFQERFGVPKYAFEAMPTPGEPYRICRPCFEGIEVNLEERLQQIERERIKDRRFVCAVFVICFVLFLSGIIVALIHDLTANK